MRVWRKPIGLNGRRTMATGLGTYGPPGLPTLSERDWLVFLWQYHCCSVQRARDYLWQFGAKPSTVREYAAHAAKLPDEWRERIAGRIGKMILENDRLLDPPGWRADTANQHKA